MPCVLHGSFCRFEWEFSKKIVHAGWAASENEDYAGENEVVGASLYSLCWSLRDHRVQLGNKSRHLQLQEKVCETTESNRNDFVDVHEFQREADIHRRVLISEFPGARERSVGGRTELQPCSQYSRFKLHWTPSDQKGFLEVEQRSKNRYD